MGVFDSIYGKAKDTAEIAKLNLNIRDEEKKQEQQYAVLGKAYLLRHADDSEECFKEVVDRIEAHQARIDEMKSRIEFLKTSMNQGRICQFCGAAIADDAIFCTVCGKEQIAPQEPAPPADDGLNYSRRCVFCGALIADDAIFCTSCGKNQNVSNVSSQSDQAAPADAGPAPFAGAGPVSSADPGPVSPSEGLPKESADAKEENVSAQPPSAASDGIKRCQFCGAEMRDDAKFCVVCGKPWPIL